MLMLAFIKTFGTIITIFVNTDKIINIDFCVYLLFQLQFHGGKKLKELNTYNPTGSQKLN